MRILLSLLVSFLSVTSLWAQAPFTVDDNRLFYGGLQLGMNFSQVDGDTYSGYHKVGVVGGGLVYVRPFKRLGFSLGLGYAQKGSNESDIRETAIGPAVFRYRIHLQYAEVPLLFHLFVPGKFHYSAGFAYSRLLASKEESEDINPINISPDLYPFKPQEISGIVGINYHIYGQWFALGQYQYSLTSIRSDPQIPPGYNTGSGHEYNNLFSLKLLYLIGSATAR